MEFIVDILSHNIKELISYLLFYGISILILQIVSKNKNQRNLIFNSLQMLQIVLNQKLPDKANDILQIWIEGLNKIKDGEFSQDDKIDQFLRYLKLVSSQKGINLSDSDIEILHTLILSTFVNVEKTKPQVVASSINKFSAMNVK